jgi:hypothetical protein
MKTKIVIVALSMLAGLSAMTHVSAASGPIWTESLQSALSEGRKQNRWVLLVIYDPRNPSQDATPSLKDPQLTPTLSGFVLTRLSKESGYAQQLKKQYGLWSTGCLLLFRPDGALQAVDNGTPPPGAQSMIGHLQDMIKGKNLGGALKKG